MTKSNNTKKSGGSRSFAHGARACLKTLRVQLNHWQNTPKLRALLREHFYGNESIAFVDQLAGVDATQVASEYGKITDQEAQQRFGAPTLKEFSFWAWRACALAGVAMILKSTTKLEGKLYDLVREGLKLDGYAFRNWWGTDVGWKHQTLATILKRRGLRAKVSRNLSITDLLAQLVEGKHVLASIRGGHGSHLVLVKGFTLKARGEPEFLVNDPYIFRNQGGENLIFNQQEFQKIYLERGVISWVGK